MRDLVDAKATDVELVPGDIVYVTESWLASTAQVLEAIAPLLSLAEAAAIITLADAVSNN